MVDTSRIQSVLRDHIAFQDEDDEAVKEYLIERLSDPDAYDDMDQLCETIDP